MATAKSTKNKAAQETGPAPFDRDDEMVPVDAFFAKYEHKALGQKKKEVGAAVPYGRMGTAEDLTGMAIFLASTEADYIVAQTYNVDGGNWMS